MSNTPKPIATRHRLFQIRQFDKSGSTLDTQLIQAPSLMQAISDYTTMCVAASPLYQNLLAHKAEGGPAPGSSMSITELLPISRPVRTPPTT